jgi:hypothetical protein
VKATLAVLATATVFFFACVPTARSWGSFDYPVKRVIFYTDTGGEEKARVYALVLEVKTEKEAGKVVKKITKTWNRRENECEIYLKTLERTWYLTVCPVFTYHHKDDTSDHGEYPPLFLPLKPSDVESNFVRFFEKENADKGKRRQGKRLGIIRVRPYAPDGRVPVGMAKPTGERPGSDQHHRQVVRRRQQLETSGRAASRSSPERTYLIKVLRVGERDQRGGQAQ